MITLKYKFKRIEQDGNQFTATYEIDAPSRYQIAREVLEEYLKTKMQSWTPRHPLLPFRFYLDRKEEQCQS